MITHLIRAVDGNLYTAWCGYAHRSDMYMSEKLRWLDCSKCSARYYGKLISADDYPYRLGERQAEKVRTYKSVYPIIRKSDDEVLGFVAIHFGFGRSWFVYPLASNVAMSDAAAGVPREPFMGRDHVSHEADGIKKNKATSKEQALSFVTALVEQNQLPSRAALRADAVEIIAKIHESQVRQQARKQQQRDDNDLMAEEFSGLLDDGSLTNRQRTAIIMAVEKLGLKLGAKHEN